MSGQHFLSEGHSELLHTSARDQTVTEGGMITMRLMFTLRAQHIFQTVFFSATKKAIIL